MDKHAMESRTIWAAMLTPVAMKVAQWAGIPPEAIINFLLLYVPVVFSWLRQVTAGGLKWGKPSTSAAPLWTVAGAVLIVGCLLVTQGCQHNAVRIAETPEQRAYAVLGTYEATLETANDLLADDSPVPEAVQIEIHSAGMPVIEATRKRLRPTYTVYTQISAQLEDCEINKIKQCAMSPERVSNTLRLLTDYTAEVTDLLPRWEKTIEQGETFK